VHARETSRHHRREERREREPEGLAILWLPMANDPREQEDQQGDVATDRASKVEKVRRYKVLLHNDDYTTMEFVILVLMKFFHKSETEATHIMLSVHHKGHGVAGLYTKDVAETKVAQVHDYAKEHGMPLRLSVEPE
jgi:ATP-dependent Clp protease adaptor protein ClpS